MDTWLATKARRGVLLRPLGNTLVVMPPLAISPAEIDLLMQAVAAGVEFAVS